MNPALSRIAICAMLTPSLSALAASTVTELPFGRALPTEMGLPYSAGYATGSGVDKEGSCETALAQALAEVDAAREERDVLAFVDKDDAPVSTATCEVNSKNKATVKLTAIVVSGVEPAMSATRALEIALALKSVDPTGSGAKWYQLGRLEASSAEPPYSHWTVDGVGGIEVFPPTVTEQARGTRVFLTFVEPDLKEAGAALETVPEVGGLSIQVRDQYVQDATENPKETWRFVIPREAVVSYANGTGTLQTIHAQMQVARSEDTGDFQAAGIAAF